MQSPSLFVKEKSQSDICSYNWSTALRINKTLPKKAVKLQRFQYLYHQMKSVKQMTR